MANNERPWLTRDIGWDSPFRNIMQELGQFTAGMGGYGSQLAQMQQRAIQQQRMQEDFSALTNALKPEKMTPGQARLQTVGEGKNAKAQPMSAEQNLLQAMGQMKTKQGLAQAFQMYNQAIKGKKTESDILDYYVKDEAGNWMGRQSRVPKASYNKAQERLIKKYGQENVSFGNKPEITESAEAPDPWETRTFKSGDQLITKIWNPDKQGWETTKAPRWKSGEKEGPEPYDTRELKKGDKILTQEYQPDKGWNTIASANRWKAPDPMTRKNYLDDINSLNNKISSLEARVDIAPTVTQPEINSAMQRLKTAKKYYSQAMSGNITPTELGQKMAKIDTDISDIQQTEEEKEGSIGAGKGQISKKHLNQMLKNKEPNHTYKVGDYGTFYWDGKNAYEVGK